MVVHAFNPSTQEAEAGGSLLLQGQPGLQELVPEQAPKLQRNPVSKNQNNKLAFYNTGRTKNVSILQQVFQTQALQLVPH